MSVLTIQKSIQKLAIQHLDIQRLAVFFVMCMLAFFTSSCALTPPVQEMSNARQTISAANEAEAMRYAPEQITTAERLMKQASIAMETGDYITARDYAVEAQQYAIKARQLAVSKKTIN